MPKMINFSIPKKVHKSHQLVNRQKDYSVGQDYPAFCMCSIGPFWVDVCFGFRQGGTH